MDEADRAQAEEQQLSEMKKHYAGHKQTGVSRLFCADCGEPIPEERRRAVPGCCRCFECQERAERRR